MFKNFNLAYIVIIVFLLLLLFRSCNLNNDFKTEIENQNKDLESFKITRLQDSSKIYSQNVIIVNRDAQLKKTESEIFALEVLQIKKPKEIVKIVYKTQIKTEIKLKAPEEINGELFLKLPQRFKKIDRWFTIDGQISTKGAILIDSINTGGRFTYSVGDTLRNGLFNRLFRKSDQVVRLHIDNPNIQLQGISNIYINDRKKWYETTGFKIGFGALLGFGLGAAK